MTDQDDGPFWIWTRAWRWLASLFAAREPDFHKTRMFLPGEIMYVNSEELDGMATANDWWVTGQDIRRAAECITEKDIEEARAKLEPDTTVEAPEFERLPSSFEGPR